MIVRFLVLWCCLGTFPLMGQIHDTLLVASLERTTCYGNCPYYEIKVYANGLATYEGRQHVEHKGRFYTNIGSRRVFQLLEKAFAIDYMDLADKYPKRGLGIIDFPTCITYVKLKNEEKKIYNRNDSPKQLVEFEEYFDDLFEEVEWKLLK